MLCTWATFGGLQAASHPRVSASLHCLEHFFTLSHTLPLHDSHLNTRFLSAILQANLSWNKANTWLIKFNLTISPFGYSMTKHPKTDSRLKREFGNNGKTHSHLNLEAVQLLNHMNMNLLKHNNTPWSLYAEKHEMHMKQAWCDQAKMELRNKPWLDQPSEHHKVVITVLIHTWNEHKDIQVNKHEARHLYVQHSTNAYYTRYMHLGTILQGHKSDST